MTPAATYAILAVAAAIAGWDLALLRFALAAVLNLIDARRQAESEGLVSRW